MGFLEFPQWLSGKETACNAGVQEVWVLSLGQEDPLEEGTATLSSTLAWRIPWTEEPGGLQSVGSQSQTRRSHFPCQQLSSPAPVHAQQRHPDRAMGRGKL